MLSSITPLGQRGRGMSWVRTVVAFWIGAALAGASLFVVASYLGSLFSLADLNPWYSLGVLGLAVILDFSPLRVPGPRRQVNEDWLGRYRDWVVGFGFGAQLGLGFATIVPTFATWALVLVAASLSPGVALLMGAGFGVGRSLLLVTTRSVRSTPALGDSMRRFARIEPWGERLMWASYALVFLMVTVNVVL